MKWDVKSFRTDWQNGYDINDAMSSIQKEFDQGNNVILDTSKLATWAREELFNSIKTMKAPEGWEWMSRIRLYP